MPTWQYTRVLQYQGPSRRCWCYADTHISPAHYCTAYKSRDHTVKIRKFYWNWRNTLADSSTKRFPWWSRWQAATGKGTRKWLNTLVNKTITTLENRHSPGGSQQRVCGQPLSSRKPIKRLHFRVVCSDEDPDISTPLDPGSSGKKRNNNVQNIVRFQYTHYLHINLRVLVELLEYTRTRNRPITL